MSDNQLEEMPEFKALISKVPEAIVNAVKSRQSVLPEVLQKILDQDHVEDVKKFLITKLNMAIRDGRDDMVNIEDADVFSDAPLHDENMKFKGLLLGVPTSSMTFAEYLNTISFHYTNENASATAAASGAAGSSASAIDLVDDENVEDDEDDEDEEDDDDSHSVPPSASGKKDKIAPTIFKKGKGKMTDIQILRMAWGLSAKTKKEPVSIPVVENVLNEVFKKCNMEQLKDFAKIMQLKTKFTKNKDMLINNIVNTISWKISRN